MYKSFENTVGKGEIAHNEQFLLFPQCFLPFWRTFCHFHQIWNCGLQSLSVWASLKFVVWETINPFQNKPWFLHVCCKNLLKTLRKGEIACNKQFLLFPQCFLPVLRPFCHFHQFWNCGLQTLSVWVSLKFVIWETVKKSGVYVGRIPCYMKVEVLKRIKVYWNKLLKCHF